MTRAGPTATDRSERSPAVPDAPEEGGQVAQMTPSPCGRFQAFFELSGLQTPAPRVRGVEADFRRIERAPKANGQAGPPRSVHTNSGLHNSFPDIFDNSGVTDQATQCLNNQKLADGVVAIAKRAKDEIKLTGTPTFVIDGKVYGGELTSTSSRRSSTPVKK